MPNITPNQHLQRGNVSLERTDLCGQRAQLLREEAKDRAATIANSARLIQDPDTQLTIIKVPGASDFALPTFVLTAIRSTGRPAAQR
jgi:hypothetical protein